MSDVPPIAGPGGGTPPASRPGVARPGDARGGATGWRAGLALALAEGAVLWVRVAAVLLLLAPLLLVLLLLR